MKKVTPYLYNLYNRWSNKRLIRLLALVLALTVAPAVVFAQEWDHVNGRHKVNDPTGAWLIRNSEGQFIYPHRLPQWRNVNWRRPGGKRF